MPTQLYTYMCNIIMCHRRCKHLGTAENGRTVKVVPICTGCFTKTGKFKVTLNHK